MNAARSVCLARPAAIEDLDDVAAFLHERFGTRPNPETLRWKFGGPTGRMTGSAVLLDGRRIVGFLGQIPGRIGVMGHELQSAQGADLGILESHRRLDAFLLLIQASAREMESAGVALTYGVAGADAATSLSALLGRSMTAPPPLLVRPLRGPWAWLSGLVRRLCVAPGCNGGMAGLLPVKPDRFDARFDRFWERIRHDYRIMPVRDTAFLNWRYGGHSGIAYEPFALANAASGEIEGYAVLSLTRRGQRTRGRICDLVTPRRGLPAVGRALIATALARLRARGADIVDIWMFPHVHLRPLLLRQGFIPRRTGPSGFHAGALTPRTAARYPGLDRAANWHLALGDTDTV
jgi:hypothetical protein